MNNKLNFDCKCQYYLQQNMTLKIMEIFMNFVNKKIMTIKL